MSVYRTIGPLVYFRMDKATETYMATLGLSLIDKPDENNNINPILYVEVYEQIMQQW